MNKLWSPQVICFIVSVVAYVALKALKLDVPAWLETAIPVLSLSVQAVLGSVLPKKEEVKNAE